MVELFVCFNRSDDFVSSKWRFILLEKVVVLRGFGLLRVVGCIC